MSQLIQNYLFDGRYKLLKKLGEGGFSEVWLVEDTSAQLTLVLKVFLPSSQLDESGVELFRKEFALVYNLNHPNLLKYTFFGDCDGKPYLVMPYYNSGSAEDLLGNCSERKAWQFLHDVAAGLACLHDHQPPIIHQDIKPANVLMDGSSFIITDFGISSNVRNMLGLSEEERSTVQGTLPYMPPEKFMSDMGPLVASDIWALGASMYEMLTGRLPFGGRGGQLQMEGETVPPLHGNFSDDLKEIVLQCLSYNPVDRPFAADLAQFASEKIVLYTTGASRITTGNYSFPSIKISGSQAYNSSNPVSPKSPDKSRKGLIIGISAGAVVLVGIVLAMLLGGKGKSAQSTYDEAMSFYRRGCQSYHQGVSNTQGQLDKFKHAIACFDSAQYNKDAEFRESGYVDSINFYRGKIFDYCLDEAKKNYSGAFYEDGLRREVVSYLELAKNINNTNEVNHLIDSVKYVYIPEE